MSAADVLSPPPERRTRSQTRLADHQAVLDALDASERLRTRDRSESVRRAAMRAQAALSALHRALAQEAL